MKYIYRICFWTLLTFLSHEITLATGWTQAKGEHYFKLSTRTLVGSKAFTIGSENTVDVGSYQDHQLNFYFEYGIRPDLTLVIFGSPVGYASIEDEKSFYSGAETAGLRWRFMKGVWNLALEGHLSASPPIGIDPLFETTYLSTKDNTSRPLKYQTNIENYYAEAQLQLARNFGSVWTTAKIGFRANTNKKLDPILLASLQVGNQWSNGVRINIDLSLFNSLGEIETINASGVGQTRYVGLNLSAALPVHPNWNGVIGLGGAPFAESNAATPSIYFGFETN